MNKHGFTLLELIIVVVIIAILAGAVLPYVQQYVEESRISKAKADLTEIRNALVRYETDQTKPYVDTTISRLVGPYLSKGMSDPWGSPYVIAPVSSKCYSLGSDRTDATGDEIEMDFRPPLAISKAYWEDSNKNVIVDTGDKIIVKFTRPLRKLGGDGPQLLVAAPDDFIYSEGQPLNDYTGAIEYLDYDMTVKMTLDFGLAVPFRAGLATIEARDPNTIRDGDGTPCKVGQATVIKAF